VVAELDDSPASVGVLRRAFEEAQLRGVPLRVLTVSRSRFTDSGAVAGGNRLAEAQLNRRLAEWKKRYADVDMRAVAVHGSTLNFLTENARSIQLLVVGRERAHGITELVGPPRHAALHNAPCSVLICETQNIL
jgi:nucleotide-binding universal stress UspA family protein